MGGGITGGWRITWYPGVHIEAAYHFVWRDPKGQLVDVTAPMYETMPEQGITTFIPVSQAPEDFTDNRFLILVDDADLKRIVALYDASNRATREFQRLAQETRDRPWPESFLRRRDEIVDFKKRCAAESRELGTLIRQRYGAGTQPHEEPDVQDLQTIISLQILLRPEGANPEVRTPFDDAPPIDKAPLPVMSADELLEEQQLAAETAAAMQEFVIEAFSGNRWFRFSPLDTLLAFSEVLDELSAAERGAYFFTPSVLDKRAGFGVPNPPWPTGQEDRVRGVHVPAHVRPRVANDEADVVKMAEELVAELKERNRHSPRHKTTERKLIEDYELCMCVPERKILCALRALRYAAQQRISFADLFESASRHLAITTRHIGSWRSP